MKFYIYSEISWYYKKKNNEENIQQNRKQVKRKISLDGFLLSKSDKVQNREKMFLSF